MCVHMLYQSVHIYLLLGPIEYTECEEGIYTEWMGKFMSKLHKNENKTLSYFIRYINQNFMEIFWYTMY